MGFSRAGARLAIDLMLKLEQLSPDTIVHSDMRRTRRIAERVADALSIEAQADCRWKERDFGDWEGRSWNAIYRETGNDMDGMLDSPQEFRPGGGETTAELAERSLAAWGDLPTSKNVAVISHGGPIAVILMKRNNDDLFSITRYIPETCSISEA